jgi:hypothetical protein
MTIPQLAEEDLAALATAFPMLDFTDAECQTVLLASGRIDVQAAPGSGKTTILAAKLYLLSRKWTSDRHGICVISHTNTAANEIRHRLAATPEGTRLLAYPHFIGTIHAFINQFLALPRLRSDGGMVDVIDDDVFGGKALSRALKNKSVWGWIKNGHGRDDVVRAMRFNGPELEVVSGKGFPSAGTTSGDHLREVKWNLAAEGVFRHRDMFAFAERALSVAPRLATLLAKRFPLVMIDEMQDTSHSQIELLRKAFAGRSVIQRLGDINQRIFADDDDQKNVPFPEEPHLPMTGSRRFGPVVAGIVSQLRQGGHAVVGKGPDLAAPPTLLVYSPGTIERVIPRFGELVLDSFDDDMIAVGGHVRAICARRSGNSKELAGRHIGDFWPPLAVDSKKVAPKQTNAWLLLAEDAEMGLYPIELGDRAERVRRIILLALREAKAPIAANVREPWRLFRTLRDTDADLRSLRRTIRDIVMNSRAGSTDMTRAEVVNALYTALQPLLLGTKRENFADLEVFANPANNDVGTPAQKALECICPVSVGDRHVKVTIDTVGMTKGETHLATLYLESIGHPSGRFDVVEALASMTGRKTSKGKPPESLAAQMRYTYVGFSRPTRFLCLAVNSERLDEGDLGKLIDAGWRIQSII